MRRQRLEVCADLVGDIAGRGSAVAADDAEIDFAVAHQMAAGIVGDDGMRHPVLRQFPGGEARPLVARPGLVDPDMQRNPVLMRAIDRRQRGAPIDRRQPAGVAMRQDLHRPAGGLGAVCRGDQLPAVLADGAVDRDILLGDLAGAFERHGEAPFRRRLGQHPAQFLDRPAQIDRGRPGRGQAFGGMLDAAVGGILGHGQRHAVGRGGADQRSAAHLHIADRPCRVIELCEAADHQLMRQKPLVDDLHRPPVIRQPDRAHRPAGDVHRGLSLSAPGRRRRRAGPGPRDRVLRAR